MLSAQLLEFAISQRGQGWLGAMQIIDIVVGCPDIPLDQAMQIRSSMQQEIGQQILGGELGCDEWAMTHACNQCIETAIQLLKQRCSNLNSTRTYFACE